MLLLLHFQQVRGIGSGAAMIPPAGAAYVGLEHQDIPDAGIIARVAQRTGGSVGIADLAVVFQHIADDAHTPSAWAGGFDAAFGWAMGLHRRCRHAVPAPARSPRASDPADQAAEPTATEPPARGSRLQRGMSGFADAPRLTAWHPLTPTTAPIPSGHRGPLPDPRHRWPPRKLAGFTSTCFPPHGTYGRGGVVRRQGQSGESRAVAGHYGGT